MTVVSLEALRLAKQIPGLDADGYTRAAASPINPPADLELEVLPEDEVVGADILMTWYWREAPTEDGDIHFALYVPENSGSHLPRLGSSWRMLTATITLATSTTELAVVNF